MKRSPLHDRHLELDAKMLPFAGWEMPIQYEGIVAEHNAVRDSCGVFDISHMGEVVVSGSDCGAVLNGILTNDVSALNDGEGQYTLMLNEQGGVIDDLIVYRETADQYLLVVNASKVSEDVDWLRALLPQGITLDDQSSRLGALAIQGPQATEIWDQLEPSRALPKRNGITRFGEELIVCRTGYTGEDGFELIAPSDQINGWFDRFLEAGAVPCGLGARDTLRLEKGFPLNGSDLDETHTPLEAGLGFFVKLTKNSAFPGRSVVEQQKQDGLRVRLAAIAMTGKGPPPRHGYEVRDGEGETVLGELTSGSLSPGLKRGIGMAYLPVEFAATGKSVSIMIRDRAHAAEVVKKPFV